VRFASKARCVLVCLRKMLRDEIVVAEEETKADESQDDVDLLPSTDGLLERKLLRLECAILATL
jgi:hypothetical protein